MTRPPGTPEPEPESEQELTFDPLDHLPDATDAEQRELSRLVLINRYTVDDAVRHVMNERSKTDTDT